VRMSDQASAAWKDMTPCPGNPVQISDDNLALRVEGLVPAAGSGDHMYVLL
jgi:hypothetical protein